MAGGVPDRQQDWYVSALRLRKRRVSPFLPIDGIVLVLQQIRARCGAQSVDVGASSRYVDQ
jgi:hypothetical protein